MKRTVVVTAIVALLVGSIGGYAAGRASFAAELRAEHEKGVEEGRMTAQNEINARFVAQGLGASLDEPVKSVYGFVKEVDADGFVIEYDSAQFSFVEFGKVTKKVGVASGVTMQKMIALPAPAPVPATAGAKKTVSGGATSGEPAGGPPGGGPGAGGSVNVLELPSGGKDAVLAAPPATVDEANTVLQTSEPITLADLAPGDYVQVTASNDIRTADTIQADMVVAYDKGALPPVGSDPGTLPFSRGGAKLDGTPYIPSK